MFSDLRSLARRSWLLLIFSASASAATFLAEGYSIRVWRTEDGLPDNIVTSAVQTHDGYLWFGTHSGLARFDGERFRVFDSANTPELTDSRVSCLFEDAKGVLWIGQESGTITRAHNNQFQAVPLRAEPTHARILGIGSDEQDHLWAMRKNGVVDSLDDGHQLESLITAEEHPGIMAWGRSPRGTILLTENARAARLENGRVTEITFDGAGPHYYVSAVAPSIDGGTWVLGDESIRKWKNGRWTENRGGDIWPPGALSTCIELRDGTLAVGTVNFGLFLIYADQRRPVHLSRNNGLPQDWIRFLYEDREGTLWVGAGSAGLAAVHATAFSVLNSPDQWQGYSVHSVAPGKDGSLWIGTDGAGLYRYDGQGWSHYGAAEGLGNPYIWGLIETPAGEVWVGNFWWGGPYRLDHDHFTRPPSVDPKSDFALALLPDRRTGDLLVGTRDGLTRVQSDRSIDLIRSADFPVTDATSLAQDQQGVIWCGFTRGGLARVADGKVTLFGRKDGIGSDSVQSLFADDDGALWIGTADNGLTRLAHGRFVTLGVAQGLVDKVICHILDDGLGYIWLSTHRGLQRIAKNELNRWADGLSLRVEGQSYDQYDGLPVIEFTGGLNSAGCRTNDGRLWFASSKGVVCVDAKSIQPNPTPPPVVIESLLVDGHPVILNQGAGLRRIPPDHQRLEFQFSGLSYVAPNKVLFKYRLEGNDRTWVEAGPKRTAFYSHLPAGNYRFQVIACNNDGVWSPEAAVLTFTVLPYVWETWWFISAAIVILVIGVAMLARTVTRRRMQKRMQLLERQRELERERARIAQDIHDDIGTSLIRIAMFSQPERNEIDQPQQTAAVLARIYSTAREMTRALDEIVWAIDPRHDTLDSLIGYMGRFAQELLGAAAIRCRLDVPVDVPAWPLTAEIRHNLFLAFKEALNNVVKHAGATEVRISLEIREREFVVGLRDNGRGFDRDRPAVTAGRIASGNGLPNIERRISRLGGRCDVSSEAGQGTSLSFVIPVSKTVATSAHRAGS